MTPNEVAAMKFTPREDCRIGFPLDKYHTAMVHWEKGKGYYVCDDRQKCFHSSLAHRKFCFPVVYYRGRTPVLGWWTFGQRGYEKLARINKEYPLARYELSVRVVDAQYQRLEFSAYGEVCLQEFEKAAEQMMLHLPFWKGYRRPSKEPEVELRLTRVGLLFNT